MNSSSLAHTYMHLGGFEINQRLVSTCAKLRTLGHCAGYTSDRKKINDDPHMQLCLAPHVNEISWPSRGMLQLSLTPCPQLTPPSRKLRRCAMLKVLG